MIGLQAGTMPAAAAPAPGAAVGSSASLGAASFVQPMADSYSRLVKACNHYGDAGTYCDTSNTWYFAISGTYHWHYPQPSGEAVHADPPDCSEYASSGASRNYTITVTYCGIINNNTTHTQYGDGENAGVQECNPVDNSCNHSGHYLRVDLHPDGSYTIVGR
jgi:hypothetical protein